MSYATTNTLLMDFRFTPNHESSHASVSDSENKKITLYASDSRTQFLSTQAMSLAAFNEWVNAYRLRELLPFQRLQGLFQEVKHENREGRKSLFKSNN